MPRIPLFHMLLLVLSLSATHVRAYVPACFYPDGTLSQDYACRLDTDESFCCAVGFACLENKICVGNANVNGKAVPYNRGSCTDQTWQSPECPQFCKDFHPSGGWLVVQCDPSNNPDEVCCFDAQASDPNACCTNSSANVFTLVGAAAAFTSIGSGASTMTRSLATSSSSGASSTSSITTSSTSLTTSATPTGTVDSTSADHTRSSISGGGYAGIAVAALVVVLAGVATWLLCIRRRRRRRNVEPKTHSEPIDYSGAGHERAAKPEVGGKPLPQDLTGPREMAGERQVAEMSAQARPPLELEGDHSQKLSRWQ